MYIKNREPLFTGQNVGASRLRYGVYEGTEATSGEVNVSRAEKMELFYRAATLNATRIALQIEGMSDANQTWGRIATMGITSANTIHTLYTITNQCKRIRVGASIDTTASPNNLYVDLLYCE